MFNIFDKKPFQTLIVIGLVILVVELILLDSHQMFWLLILGIAAYFLWQQYYREPNRILFWIAVVIMISILFDLYFFRIFFGVIIIWFIIYYVQNQSDDKQAPRPVKFSQETIEESEILYSNKWFGQQKRGEEPYRWQDFNSQTLIGQTEIDLTQTVLPKDEPLILVRHLAGTIKIIVPYDVEVSIHHSVLIGSVDIFDYGYDQITNRVIHYQTEHYQTANQRVKIYTTMIAGKIEVVRG